MGNFSDKVEQVENALYEYLEGRSYDDEDVSHDDVRKLLQRTPESVMGSYLTQKGDDRGRILGGDDFLHLVSTGESGEQVSVYERLREEYQAEPYDYDGVDLETVYSTPSEDVSQAIERMLASDDDSVQFDYYETVEGKNSALADYLSGKTQGEIHEDLANHSDDSVSNASRHISPDLGPRGESTYYTLKQRYCDEPLPVYMRTGSDQQRGP